MPHAIPQTHISFYPHRFALLACLDVRQYFELYSELCRLYRREYTKE